MGRLKLTIEELYSYWPKPCKTHHTNPTRIDADKILGSTRKIRRQLIDNLTPDFISNYLPLKKDPIFINLHNKWRKKSKIDLSIEKFKKQLKEYRGGPHPLDRLGADLRWNAPAIMPPPKAVLISYIRQ
ncbi:MAG: hypothetical protein Q7U10_02865 [Thermodesulfovibrionia bacterium]|nr:hypothetical protein [Thermodesulfovibrionia bacterium]